MILNDELKELGKQLTATTVADRDRLKAIRERLNEIIRVIGSDLQMYIGVVDKHIKEAGGKSMTKKEKTSLLAHLEDIRNRYDPILSPVIYLFDVLAIEAARYPYSIRPGLFKEIDTWEHTREVFLKSEYKLVKWCKNREKNEKIMDKLGHIIIDVDLDEKTQPLIAKRDYKGIVKLYAKAVEAADRKKKRK